MYADGSNNRYAPYEQFVEDNVDDYIHPVSYETDQSNYGIQNPGRRNKS